MEGGGGQAMEEGCGCANPNRRQLVVHASDLGSNRLRVRRSGCG